MSTKFALPLVVPIFMMRNIECQNTEAVSLGLICLYHLVSGTYAKLRKNNFLAYTLAANVIESPTRWLHGFLFRHDFEKIRHSSYKPCSRDYFYICRQQINVRKCSTNADGNMLEGCGVMPTVHSPLANSHLALKLKINTAHWNNSLHINGTWYCPSNP